MKKWTSDRNSAAFGTKKHKEVHRTDCHFSTEKLANGEMKYPQQASATDKLRGEGGDQAAAVARAVK